MATIKGANRTIMDAITPATILGFGAAGGNVRCMIDSYTADGTELTGTVIEMGGEIPTGATVLNVIVYNADGVAVMAVGDAESSGRYEDSVAAGATEHCSVAGGMGYVVDMTTATTPDNQILLTTSGATLTALGVTVCVILYAIE